MTAGRLWVIEWRRKGVREAWKPWSVTTTWASARDTLFNTRAYDKRDYDYRAVLYQRRVTP